MTNPSLQRLRPQSRKLKRPLQSDVQPILKKAKLTHATEPVNRPIKDAVKPRVTVNMAKILKRTPMKQIFPKRVPRKRVEPEHDLFLDYKGKKFQSKSVQTPGLHLTHV